MADFSLSPNRHDTIFLPSYAIVYTESSSNGSLFSKTFDVIEAKLFSYQNEVIICMMNFDNGVKIDQSISGHTIGL